MRVGKDIFVKYETITPGSIAHVPSFYILSYLSNLLSS